MKTKLICSYKRRREKKEKRHRKIQENTISYIRKRLEVGEGNIHRCQFQPIHYFLWVVKSNNRLKYILWFKLNVLTQFFFFTGIKLYYELIQSLKCLIIDFIYQFYWFKCLIIDFIFYFYLISTLSLFLFLLLTSYFSKLIIVVTNKCDFSSFVLN